MEMKVYSLFDNAAKAFTQPMFFHNDGMAMRTLSAQVNAKEENNLKNHPLDFCLYQVGEWDDVKGLLIALDVPRRVVVAHELIEEQPVKKDELAELTNSLKQHGKHLESVITTVGVLVEEIQKIKTLF